MNVLVDTSIWVAHFRQQDAQLVTLLNDGLVVCHPYVIAEIACGTPPNRRELVHMLADLEQATVATTDEVLTLIERQQLYGRGCGFVDVSLLASALLSTHTQLLTSDARLLRVAQAMGCAYQSDLTH
jgi:hypothetical protein